jgi:RNA polymerase sigma-70 factor
VGTRPKNTEQSIEAATEELLSRASDSRGVDLTALIPRVSKVVEKYLLRDNENATAEEIRSFIAGLQIDDLCLVMGCERGEQTAWNDLVERFSVTVRSAARSATSNEDAAEDLAQSIWAELHGLKAQADGRPTGKLSYYSGRGSLAGWLRAVVSQLAVDQHRKQSRLVQTEEDSDFDRMATDVNKDEHSSSILQVGSPAESIENKFAAREIKSALTKAVGSLEPEDRLLVKLYYFDELRLREAGAVLGVHEATASRRLTKIHQTLRNEVQRVLMDDHHWTKTEAERSFAEVAMHLDTNLEQLVSTGISRDEPANTS